MTEYAEQVSIEVASAVDWFPSYALGVFCSELILSRALSLLLPLLCGLCLGPTRVSKRITRSK